MWIGELGTFELDDGLWGAKAANLSLALSIGGFNIPPTLCVLPAAWRTSGPVALRGAISAWIQVHAPERVIVRSSEHGEDGVLYSRAGESTTVADCLPDADAVLAALRAIGSHELGSVLVQTQIEGQWSGVAMGSDTSFQAEASQTPRAVTGGMEVEVLLRYSMDAVEITGIHSPRFPARSISRGLAQCFRSLVPALSPMIDIEWIWKDGAVYLVQARPMTTDAPK